MSVLNGDILRRRWIINGLLVVAVWFIIRNSLQYGTNVDTNVPTSELLSDSAAKPTPVPGFDSTVQPKPEDPKQEEPNKEEYGQKEDTHDTFSWPGVSKPPALNLDRPNDKPKNKNVYPFNITGAGAAFETVVQGKKDKPKACFVSLVRNSEIWELTKSIASVQDKFNGKFDYPWVFLNDEPFTEEFKKHILAIVPNSKFGLIPKEHWSYPDYISQERAAKARVDMKDIIYGDSESYRHMCRFQSGFFFQHPLLAEYDWYWRVEPSTELYCTIDYDVFQFMQDNDITLGFTITIHEYRATIETLWETTKKFLEENPGYVHKDNLLGFISDDGGNEYNLCHFWSNFEVANLNFYRSKAYLDYFNYLDKSGGFFYERWGDAPIHSIAASIMLSRDRIHYFNDIGYHHPPYSNCPFVDDIRSKGKCTCDPEIDFTFRGYACGKEYFNSQGFRRPENWEKYT